MDDCLGRLKYTTVGQASARQTGRSPVVYHESHRSAMRNLAVFLILAPCLLTAQGRGAPAAAPAAAGIVGRDFVRENYSKFEYRIPVRDGVKLFTSVYVPKDAITDHKTYPIMMQRTGYNVAPYGSDQSRAHLASSEL